MRLPQAHLHVDDQQRGAFAETRSVSVGAASLVCNAGWQARQRHTADHTAPPSATRIFFAADASTVLRNGGSKNAGVFFSNRWCPGQDTGNAGRARIIPGRG